MFSVPLRLARSNALFDMEIEDDDFTTIAGIGDQRSRSRFRTPVIISNFAVWKSRSLKPTSVALLACASSALRKRAPMR